MEGPPDESAAEKEGEDAESSADLSAYLIEPTAVTYLSLIGQGSTSIVYLGLLKNSTHIAVKEIQGVQEETLTAFQRELCILVKVKHPHIVSFLGLIHESYPLRLCLEYCQGGSLFDLLHNHTSIRLSWRQRLVTLYDTATAVDHLHSFRPRIVHRDLKSLNVLLLRPISEANDIPHVKLADFGFARESEARMTQGAGTSHWMAPEVFSGTAYTEMADIFSFAMIAYEVVFRRIPFDATETSKVSSLISTGNRPEISESSRQEVPPGLIELIERCWHQDPQHRPTFTVIWQDLAKVSADTPDHMKLAAPEDIRSL
jgi:serine/threonine protein kinase